MNTSEGSLLRNRGSLWPCGIAIALLILSWVLSDGPAVLIVLLSNPAAVPSSSSGANSSDQTAFDKQMQKMEEEDHSFDVGKSWFAGIAGAALALAACFWSGYVIGRFPGVNRLVCSVVILLVGVLTVYGWVNRKSTVSARPNFTSMNTSPAIITP